MPLIRQHLVVHGGRSTGFAQSREVLGTGRNDPSDMQRADAPRVDFILHDRNSRYGGKAFPDLREIGVLVKCDPVPAIHSRPIVNRFPLGVVVHDSLEAVRTNLFKQRIDILHTRTGRTSLRTGGCLLGLRGGHDPGRLRREFHRKSSLQGNLRSRSPNNSGSGLRCLQCLLHTSSRCHQAATDQQSLHTHFS